MNLSDAYRGITKVTVGDGSTVLFWKDLWQDQLLETSHPRAFSFVKNEDTSIAPFLAMATLHEGFHMPLSTQSREEIQELQLLTASMTPVPERKDIWTCSWGAKYSARKFYAFYLKDVEADEVFRWIWKSRCTMKIKMFAWLLAADRINTRNMIKRRHWNVSGGFNYALCDAAIEETVEHLFFDCPFSISYWASINMHWGVRSISSTRYTLARRGG